MLSSKSGGGNDEDIPTVDIRPQKSTGGPALGGEEGPGGQAAVANKMLALNVAAFVLIVAGIRIGKNWHIIILANVN